MNNKAYVSFILILSLIIPMTNINAQTTSNTACSSIGLNRVLKQGSTGTDVFTLQKVLNQSPLTQIAKSGAGSPGKETRSFGSATKAALIKFQKSAKLVADGIAGAGTYNALNSRCLTYAASGGATSTNNSIAVVNTTPVSPTFTFKNNLSLGSKSTDVTVLQKVLNLNASTLVAAVGLGSKGKETNSFGPATKTAVIKFQKKYAIVPANGNVGPLTRTKLNEFIKLAANTSGGAKVTKVDNKTYQISGLTDLKGDLKPVYTTVASNLGGGGGSSSSSTSTSGGGGGGNSSTSTSGGGGGGGSSSTSGGGGGGGGGGGSSTTTTTGGTTDTTGGTTTGGTTTGGSTTGGTTGSPVNSNPSLINDTFNTSEDSSLSGNVLSNDSDTDGDTLTVTSYSIDGTSHNAAETTTLASKGEFILNANGGFIFVPVSNYNGTLQTITYTVSDGKGGTGTGTLINTITAVNDNPTPSNDADSVLQNTTTSGNVLTNDTDVEGNTLSVSSFIISGTTYAAGNTARTIASVGTISITSTGAYTFIPTSTYSGTVPAITYTVSDGNGGTSTATLTISVTAVNSNPVTTNDTKTTPYNTTTTGNVLTNDTDPDSDTLSVSSFIISGTTHTASSTARTIASVGTLAITSTGAYTFIPTSTYSGTTPAITYAISDGKGGTATGTLTITVTPKPNSNPTPQNDTGTNGSSSSATGNVLTNDTDPDGDTLTVLNFIATGTTFTTGTVVVLDGVGTITINSNGTYTFTPQTNYYGAVPVITYQVSDGKGGTAFASLILSITPNSNRSPVGVNDTDTVVQNGTVSGNVLTNDTDQDNDTLTVTSFTVNGETTVPGTTKTITGVGSLVINSNGLYSFTPATDYTGTVPTATYTLDDSRLGTATATLTITISPNNTNVNPVGVNDTKSTAINTTATGNVLTNDTDANGDTLVVTGFTVNNTNYPVTGSGSSTTVLGNNTIGGTKLFISDNGLATKFVPSVNGRINSITAYFSRTDTSNGDAAKVAVYADNAGKPGTLLAHSITSIDPVIAAGSWATFSSLTEDVTGGLNVIASTPVWFAVTTNYSTAVRINSSTGGTNQTSESGSDMSDMVFDATWNHVAYQNNQMSIYANVTSGSGGASSATISNVGTISLGSTGIYTFTPTSTFTGTVPTVTYTVSDGKGGTATATLVITVNSSGSSALKIMPLGDSITDGYSTPGGYRIKLEALLKAASVSYDFVGSQSNGPTNLTDKNHEGHSGYKIDDIKALTQNAIQTYTPNTVLLMIGTNDIGQNYLSSTASARLSSLIDTIRATNSTAKIFVASIPPDYVNPYSTQLTSYNSAMKTMVDSRIANGEPLVFVDINPLIGQSDLADGVHPNQTGYDKMADKWYSSMQSAGLVPGGTTNSNPVGINDTISTSQNTPVTSNVLTNDTDANGDTLSITQFVVNSTTYTASTTSRTITNVGTIVLNTTGAYTFVPTSTFTGTVPTITYTVSDGKGGTATATLTITVNSSSGGSGAWNNSTNTFTYTLSSSAVTSAGVYDSNGTLVRTLWSNVTKSAGSNTGTWDKKNDAGTTLTGTGYSIKVLSNNVTYTWEGIVGNSSTNKSGENVIRALRSPREGIVIGSNLYVTTGFVEGDSSISKISLSNLGVRDYVMPTVNRDIDLAVTKAASDGTYVYWSGFDSYSAKSFTFATKVSDDTEVLLSSGSSVNTIYGRTYPKAIDIITNNTAADPTGIAVQKTGNYLYISHGGINQINVFNKSTGASVRTISITSPQGLAIDGNNNLWIASGTTVKKYQINSDGTLASPSLTISGLSKPLSIAISPDNSTIAVVDAGSSQQVKAFSTSTGNSSWTLGQSGGYANNATVSDDRFMFLDINDSVELGFVAYQSDGSFWVGDPGNARTIQYNSSRVAIGRVEYFPMGYSANADRNNPTRVFSHFLEYAVDYSKPLAGANGSWSLTKNWRGNLSTSNYEMNQTSIFENLITLSNGKTYGTLQKYVNNGERAPEVFELTSSGTLRSTGIVFPAWSSIEIEQDGSVYEFSSNWNSGQGGYLTKRSLTGFTNNNPVWGSATNVATIPTITTSDPALGGVRRPVLTSSGIVALFNQGQADNMYHLGGIKLGDNKYAFKTAKSTGRTYTGAYPNDGGYDNGNNCEYCGANVYAVDKNIFWNYNGEFWKNSQVNKWQHVSDNGLLIGIFGVTTPEAQAQYGIHSAPEAAGNAYRGQVVKVGNDYYIYHNDESEHSGVHRWKISNLSSIAETSITVN